MLEEMIKLFRYDNKKVADLDNEELQTIADYLEQLQGYQQLEADGRLVKLPCKVGDTVYIIAPNYCDCREECDDYDSEQYLVTWCKEYCPNGYKGIGVIEAQIEQIEIGNDIYFYTNKNARNDSGNIFLTKSEAEAKLKELEDI